jgi:hypothetical protein
VRRDKAALFQWVQGPHHLRKIMGKLKLTVNEDKTRICRVPEGEFDFSRHSRC